MSPAVSGVEHPFSGPTQSNGRISIERRSGGNHARLGSQKGEVTGIGERKADRCGQRVEDAGHVVPLSMGAHRCQATGCSAKPLATAGRRNFQMTPS